MSKQAWWGFDIDKTLAVDEGGIRGGEIGTPIKPLIRRMKHYLRTGRKVAIVSARVHPSEPDAGGQTLAIRAFLEGALGSMELAEKVEIRADKDRHMIALYDDRAEQVIPNKGILVREELRRTVEALVKIVENVQYEPYSRLMAQDALASLDPWSIDLAIRK